MGAISWIKLHVGTLDDEKILLILSLPEGDAIFIIWIGILTLAGKANNSGYVTLCDTV